MKEKIRAYFEEHLAFILTFFITYILGSLIITIVFLIDCEKKPYTGYEIVKIYIEFLTPTTFAYALTNGITNLVQVKFKKQAVWNWVLIFSSIAYAFWFIIYQLKWSKLGMVISMSIFTLILIIFNFLGYNEYYLNKNQNHSISAKSY